MDDMHTVLFTMDVVMLLWLSRLGVDDRVMRKGWGAFSTFKCPSNGISSNATDYLPIAETRASTDFENIAVDGAWIFCYYCLQKPWTHGP